MPHACRAPWYPYVCLSAETTQPPVLTDWTQLYGLIFLGSSSAFSSMVGACIVFMTTSYVIPQGIVAWRGRDKVLPPRALNLGKLGLPLNILACVWVAFIDIVYCIPTAYPVTKENMNWIRYVFEGNINHRKCHGLNAFSVVIVGLVSFLLIAWYTSQRHIFKGPNINFNLLEAARADELAGHRTLEGIPVGADDEVVVEALRNQSLSSTKKD